MKNLSVARLVLIGVAIALQSTILCLHCRAHTSHVRPPDAGIEDGSLLLVPQDGGTYGGGGPGFFWMLTDASMPPSASGPSTLLQPLCPNDGGAFIIMRQGEELLRLRNLYKCPDTNGPPCLVVDDAGTCVELHEARARLRPILGSTPLLLQRGQCLTHGGGVITCTPDPSDPSL